MNELFENLIYYKEIHPIRVWIWMIGGIVIVSVLIICIKLVLKNRTTPQFEELNKGSEDYSEKLSNDKKGIKATGSFFRNKIVANSLFLIIGIMIGSLFTTLINIHQIEHENPSISNSQYIFGIDISHHQGKIDWAEVRTSHHPIDFIFIKSTEGVNFKDPRFNENWKSTKKLGYIRGAYHYYTPNRNSIEQFNNFSSVVKLSKGDFPPILDIEKPSKFGKEHLIKGILNWLKLAEEKYGVKPVIYTGRTFYKQYLEGHTDDYPLWVASYSGKHKLENIDWDFHQFTEKVRVKGIKTTVDGNDFKGDLINLKDMCLNQ